MAGAGDHAGGAELDRFGALRDGGEEVDRLPAWFGKEAVADPDRIEPECFGPLGQGQQIGQRIVRRDQRFAVVEVDAELAPVAGS